MKFKDFPLSALNNYKKQPPREPLYTLPEIADRLGVEYDAIRAYVRGRQPTGCPPPPVPSMVTGGRSFARMRTKLYKLSEYKAWWKLRQEFANEEKP